MAAKPITLVGPATRGLGLAMARHMLRRTQLPVYATYRSGTPEAAHAAILEPLRETVDGSRLHMLGMDLTSEESIANAAGALADHLRTAGSSSDAAYLHTAFFCGGVLHPERGPDDLDAAKMLETFQLNTLSHLLAIKHFARFLPPARAPPPDGRAARWVHVSARVGSVSDNRLGGWYSYRASKAALNQVVRTFDLHLQARRIPAIAVGVHPGTVRTDLSRAFWAGVSEGKLFEPDDAATKLAQVIEGLDESQRGRIWDWKGEEVIP